jgi:hypothetical protein
MIRMLISSEASSHSFGLLDNPNWSDDDFNASMIASDSDQNVSIGHVNVLVIIVKLIDASRQPNIGYLRAQMKSGLVLKKIKTSLIFRM